MALLVYIWNSWEANGRYEDRLRSLGMVLNLSHERNETETKLSFSAHDSAG